MTPIVGLGLRTGHFNYLLKNPETKIGWFEAITENFINTEGAALHVLTRLRERYPIALHGVALSIGSVDGIRMEHLKKIKRLAERIEPFQISDHFCFSRFSRRQYHELLPLPLTFAMAQQTIRNIDKAQNYLQRPLVLENISAYAAFHENEMGEPEFLNFVARESGCKLLLDINNIYVNAANFRFNARRFIGGIDPRHVAQYHLAGFTDLDTHLFDTHAEKIHAPVLKLYREAKQLLGDKPVSLERDDRIPAFSVLEREIVRTATLKAIAMPKKYLHAAAPQYPATSTASKRLTQEKLWQKTIYDRNPRRHEKSAGSLSPKSVQKIYRNAYAIRLDEALREKFIRLANFLPKSQFTAFCKKYILAHISREEDLSLYGEAMPRFLKQQRPDKPWLADAAHFDILRHRLFAIALQNHLADPFSKKVTLTDAVSLWQSRYTLLEGQISVKKMAAGRQFVVLYREHFAVKHLLITQAEFAFINAIRKPLKLSGHLARVESENRLSSAAVKRLFRILGLPGILK